MAWAGWAIAAAVAVVLGLMLNNVNQQLSRQNAALTQLTSQVSSSQDQVHTLQSQLNEQVASNTRQTGELQRMYAMLQADQTKVESPTQPDAHGKLYWNRTSGTWNIYVDNVKAPAPGKTYELWIVTAAGQKLAAGTATPDASGRLVFEKTNIPPEGVTLAAVTDETAPGVGDNQAKGDIHFVAKFTP